MKDWLYLLKQKIEIFLEREPRRVRLLRWRDRVTKVIMFFDNNIKTISMWSIIFLFWFSFMYGLFWRAPRPFPEHTLVRVERGESLNQIAVSFEDSKVVRSSFWLKFFIIMFGGETRVIAGDYYFPKPLGIFSVASMLHKGEFGFIPIRVTIQEGLSSREIADLLTENLPAFNKDDFISQVDSGGFEGYLFPDTYFFMPNIEASDVILMMRENFARQIKQYENDILETKKDPKDIIIMASIIEDESNGSLETKRIVSGILWKRISIGMPLQVDAPFKYYNGKNSYTLTKNDLSQDHSYNTYKNKGLPPTAISNPGIDSIRAAIAPTNSEYLYFMSDKNGNVYYAKDFDGHQSNRERYLK